MSGILVTGVGVTAAIGQGQEAFAQGLWSSEGRFEVMQRPGRQAGTQFIGAEIPSFRAATRANAHALRTASLTAQVALATLEEAWSDARLDQVDAERIGLVVGGSNLQQRELVLTQERYRTRPQFLRPSYGLSFLDTDLCGLCTATFAIRGLAHTVGGASASGQLAVIEAAEAVASGRVDACVALGALMDLSYWECLGLQSMGAMVPPRSAAGAEPSCRPFDRRRCGFVFGEACGALVLERAGARRPSAAAEPYAVLSGWSVQIDGNRNPDPSVHSKVRAIRATLDRAGLRPRQIDYVNPHGTGSVLGDQMELEALRGCELTHALINATKSITGHGLTAAGAVEAVATLLQMKHHQVHPARNLDDPIDGELPWVMGQPAAADLRHCLSLSAGFGGIETAVCFSAADARSS
jgi:malonyl-ACP decarboxylase